MSHAYHKYNHMYFTEQHTCTYTHLCEFNAYLAVTADVQCGDSPWSRVVGTIFEVDHNETTPLVTSILYRIGHTVPRILYVWNSYEYCTCRIATSTVHVE